MRQFLTRPEWLMRRKSKDQEGFHTPVWRPRGVVVLGEVHVWVDVPDGKGTIGVEDGFMVLRPPSEVSEEEALDYTWIGEVRGEEGAHVLGGESEG